MKTIRTSILCFVVLLFAAPLLRAEDLSKYRNFFFGMNLTTVLKNTELKLADVKTTHNRPALLQELTWWPPYVPGMSYKSDSVEQILLSFYNGELYKISVIYDRTSTEGLTAEDMVKSISAKYGPPTSVVADVDSPANEQYEMTQKPVASWEDSQYSLQLVRSSFSGGFELAIYSKRLNAEAEVALSEAVKLDKQEEPQRKAELQKKQSDDVEAKRQKNQKSFRP
jgi:hypothetical protein